MIKRLQNILYTRNGEICEKTTFCASYYVKLQDAFVSETGTTYGSWKMIGYKMNTTNGVFTYTEKKDLSGSKETAELNSATAVWEAKPQAALNDCKTSDAWTLEIAKASSGNGAEYIAKVSSTDCNVLVPGFGKLDKSGAATIGSGS